MEKCMHRKTGKKYWYVKFDGENKSDLLNLFADYAVKGENLDVELVCPRFYRVRRWISGVPQSTLFLCVGDFVVNFDGEWRVLSNNVFLDFYYPMDSLEKYGDTNWHDFLRGNKNSLEGSNGPTPLNEELRNIMSRVSNNRNRFSNATFNAWLNDAQVMFDDEKNESRGRTGDFGGPYLDAHDSVAEWSNNYLIEDCFDLEELAGLNSIISPTQYAKATFKILQGGEPQVDEVLIMDQHGVVIFNAQMGDSFLIDDGLVYGVEVEGYPE